MSFADLMREALRALEANRGRSFLTILGIVIGIAAVIAMTSLIGGVQQSLIGSMGLNAARIVYINGAVMWEQSYIDRLAAAVPEYEFIEGYVSSFSQEKLGDTTYSVGIEGGTPRYFEMTGRVSLAEGRMFTEEENDAAACVAILDRTGVQAFFGSSDAEALGKSIEVAGRSYVVVGVADALMTDASDYFDVFLPANTVTEDFNSGVEMLSSVVGVVREGADADAVAEDTKGALAKILGYTDEEAENNLWPHTMKSSIDAMNAFMGSFQLIIGSVAGISLLVGGIGIMNMMLTNVTERIREIGVRRALGATRGDITRQFLVESAVVCVVGGIIGTVLGYLISWALALVASSTGMAASMMGMEGVALAPSISVATVALAAGLSIGVGLLFGYYPARRAAKLDPVECLRYQ